MSKISAGIEYLLKTDFAKPNLWDFVLSAAPDYRFKIQKVNLPFWSFETEDIAFYKYYSGVKGLGDVSLTFLETEKYEVMAFIEQWMGNFYDPSTRQWKVIDETRYNKLTTAFLGLENFDRIANDGSLKYEKIYKFEGLKFKNLDELSLDYDTKEGLTLQATFSVDDIVPSTNAELNQLFLPPPTQGNTDLSGGFENIG